MSIVVAKDLSVRYEIRKRQSRSIERRFRDVLLRRSQKQSFWALNDVSFKIAEGEVVGLLGSNGAGKSTLCRVLAGVMPPDSGRLRIEGKVAPLRALGTGLNRELTGRENIALSGALMGLDEAAIQSLLPKIVEFAEIGDFIDSPVRTYSSGMRSRLAFSIATSVEPDLLILDEILGVGDTYFKQKSKKRIRELMQESRAVVLVSHSTRTILRVCNKAIWLNGGKVIEDGPADKVVKRYERWQSKRGKKSATDDDLTVRSRGQRKAETSASTD